MDKHKTLAYCFKVCLIMKFGHQKDVLFIFYSTPVQPADGD